MLIFLIVFLIYAVTFVISNDKISDNSKSGFFVAIVIIGILGLLLSFLFS
jgi:hypothetical protein